MIIKRGRSSKKSNRKSSRFKEKKSGNIRKNRKLLMERKMSIRRRIGKKLIVYLRLI